LCNSWPPVTPTLRHWPLAAIYRRMIIRGGRKHAAFVVGRHILNIAYHLQNRKREVYRKQISADCLI
jgi:hypothetical protein